MKIYYLASPYSHSDPKVRKRRYEKQQEISANLIVAGYLLITPIEMSHKLSLTHKLPTGYEFWKERDRALLERCDAIIVCSNMPGWRESVGVTDEIAYAKELGKEILYLRESLSNEE